jgi:hypothetical protein
MNYTNSCSKCGVAEKVKKMLRGNGSLEVFLWFITIIPGILLFIEPLPVYYFWLAFGIPAMGYSIWRWKSSYNVCPKCRSPLDPDWQPTNRAAVAGFVFGLMFNIPLISGILAVVMSSMGKRRAKSTGGQGGSISRVALILGVLNIVGWMLVSVSSSLLWSRHPMPPPPLPKAPLIDIRE